MLNPILYSLIYMTGSYVLNISLRKDLAPKAQTTAMIAPFIITLLTTSLSLRVSFDWFCNDHNRKLMTFFLLVFSMVFVDIFSYSWG